jgi:flavin reductase (DIM6/NTAB) family NADH-FMN oxidoreductase RutF
MNVVTNWPEMRSETADNPQKAIEMENTWPTIIGKITNGIYVLTTSYKEEINGMIISWVSQVSYDPPLVMVAIHPNRDCHDMVKQSGRFALNILSINQADLIGHFKGPDPAAKFKTIEWDKGNETGCPVLTHCTAYMECDVQTSHSPGNHTLFIGKVINCQVLSEDEPLSTLDNLGTYLGKN